MKDKKQKEAGKRSVLISLILGVLALLMFLMLLKFEVKSTVCFVAALIFMLLSNGIYCIFSIARAKIQMKN